MPFDQKHCRGVFGKLGRQLKTLESDSSPEAVHKFRTSVRRVETALDALVPEPDRSTKKLMKLLARLRKKAGKVRDLDVQIMALRHLKMARESGQKAQLARTLGVERVKKTKRLAAELNKKGVRGLGRRLRRASQGLKFPISAEPVALALQGLSEISTAHSPLNQKTVHEYRIAGKRARTVLEIAVQGPTAARLSDSLKNMQDVVGDWHDWLTLTQRAEELFGGVKDSALVAALQNLTRAKFRASVDAIIGMRRILADVNIDSLQAGKIAAKQSPKTFSGGSMAA